MGRPQLIRSGRAIRKQWKGFGEWVSGWVSGKAAGCRLLPGTFRGTCSSRFIFQIKCVVYGKTLPLPKWWMNEWGKWQQGIGWETRRENSEEWLHEDCNLIFSSMLNTFAKFIQPSLTLSLVTRTALYIWWCLNSLTAMHYAIPCACIGELFVKVKVYMVYL